MPSASKADDLHNPMSAAAGLATETAGVRDLSLAYRWEGRAPGAPVVLIHGLGQTLADWPQTLIDALVGGGRRVLRFDNRDVGRSTRLDAPGRPPLLRLWLAARLRTPSLARPPYRVADMAADALGLFDRLGVEAAHVVGASMGGMIAQHMALASPERVLSLTLVMSSSGAPGLPSPRRDVGEAMSRDAAAGDLPAAAVQALRFRQLVAASLTPSDAQELEQRVMRSSAYGWPAALGAARQYAAILADRGRYRQLSAIRAPSLVVHGDRDPLLPLAHGQDLAARIAGARLIINPGMGHEVSASRGEELAASVLAHAAGAPRASG